jgi:hypothetical protein
MIEVGLVYQYLQQVSIKQLLQMERKFILIVIMAMAHGHQSLELKIGLMYQFLHRVSIKVLLYRRGIQFTLIIIMVQMGFGCVVNM